MDAPPLDEYALTTANGVRFRTTSGIDGHCGTPGYSDPVGWGFGYVTVEQNGKVRENPKFNFATPGENLNDNVIRRANVVVELFADEFWRACSQWQAASEEKKPIYLDYFHEAIRGTFEAATRFEAASKIGRNVLRDEIELMDQKYRDLTASKPEGQIR